MAPGDVAPVIPMRVPLEGQVVQSSRRVIPKPTGVIHPPPGRSKMV